MKAYVVAIRKETNIDGTIGIDLKKYIKDTKKIIKEEKYSETIERLKIIYYVLMTYQGEEKIQNIKINFHQLNKNELIDEKIKIEKELGQRYGFSSNFKLNFIFSSEIGLLTGIVSGAFMSNDGVISKIGLILGIIFILALCILIVQWFFFKLKNDLLYSLCLDTVNSLIADCTQ